ncbi:MAG TPA: hypothetical protein VN493_19385 [Thermoanaerobaculia bacterium]|nr:hypothetical protein [Thermoanaerobaculia bacterium]
MDRPMDEDERKRLPARTQLAGLDRHSRLTTVGCGALLGVVAGFFGALGSIDATLGRAALIAAFAGLLLGLLCFLFGERFLDFLVRWLSWWS